MRFNFTVPSTSWEWVTEIYNLINISHVRIRLACIMTLKVTKNVDFKYTITITAHVPHNKLSCHHKLVAHSMGQASTPAITD